MTYFIWRHGDDPASAIMIENWRTALAELSRLTGRSLIGHSWPGRTLDRRGRMFVANAGSTRTGYMIAEVRDA